MCMYVNERTGQYDQVDIFSTSTAAMAKGLMKDAAKLRTEQVTSTASSLDEDQAAETPNQDSHTKFGDFKSRDSPNLAPDLVSTTQNQINQLAMQIVDETAAKINTGFLLRPYRKSNWRTLS